MSPTTERTAGYAAREYQRFFVPHIGAPVARTLIAIARPTPGERVLDVACGTGVATRAAAEAVGAEGRVAGLDPNPGMLEVARGVEAPHPIEWHQASAESMPLPDDTFDLVLCQMGLQFVSNKRAALREMRRVLVPDGRLVLNVPGPTPGPFATLAAALSDHVNPQAAGFCHLVFSLHEPDELRELAEAGGFEELNIRREALALTGPPPADFLWGYLNATPLGAAVSELGGARRAELERDVMARWAPFTTDDGIAFEVGITTLVAR